MCELPGPESILILFDDAGVSRLEPVTTLRAAADIRCGVLPVREKWKYRTGLPVYVAARRELSALYDDIPENSEQIWVNGRWMPDAEAAASVLLLKPGEALYSKDILLAYRKSMSGEADNILEFRHERKCDFGKEPELLCLPHDIFLKNSSQIIRDVTVLQHQDSRYRTMTEPAGCAFPGVVIGDPKRIVYGEAVVLEPGVVLYPGDGVIFLDHGCTVQAGAVLRGSVCIGEGATVKMGAHLYDGTTAGPFCNVGGELQNSVLFAFSNKAHGGFLGNSVVCEWVNIGADANTSNLKNNYTSIRLDDWHSGKVTDSGLQFYGAVFGDHTKLAIGSKVNSGSYFGVCSSFICDGFSPKRTPHFAWATNAGTEPFEIERALATARAMMQRRGRELHPAMEKLLREVYNSTHFADTGAHYLAQL